ncbi:unnamed protein product [Gordionus sp. m RMFG-2023]
MGQPGLTCKLRLVKHYAWWSNMDYGRNGIKGCAVKSSRNWRDSTFSYNILLQNFELVHLDMGQMMDNTG